MNSRLQKITQAYLEGHLDRRGFLGRLTAVLGSYTLVHHYLEVSGLASGAVASLESARAKLGSEAVEYASGSFTIRGSLSVPENTKTAPGVVVIHENRGLNDHIRDVARRLAAEGYLALAPDLLSRQGGTAAVGSVDDARRLLGAMSNEAVIDDLRATLDYLARRPELGISRIGSVGFCWGGQRSFLLATAAPGLDACVVFYGSTPPEERLDSIGCPVLGLYGELDTRITSRVEATAAAMRARRKSFQYRIYSQADHAFFNDTRAERYREEAARDAWRRVLAFYDQHLRRGAA